MSEISFGVDRYDNPENIRFKKYTTGAHVVLQRRRVQTGQTPKEVVWKRGKARLYRYEPVVEKRYLVPIVLVYALILRPYILDLVPGNSLVEYLLGEGFDVYLLDWGIPESEDRHLSFEDYVLDYMPEAVGQALRSSGAEGVTLFGYCQGGTMSAMYAALFPEEPPMNLVLLTTPIDFAPEDPGLFGLWTLWSRQEYFNPDLLVGPSGNFPADVAGRIIENAGRVPWWPVANYFAAYANSWARSAQSSYTETFLGVSKWVDDGVPFPGEALRQWIRDFYQKNKLIKGELELRGRRADLANIECPLLNIAGKKDFICPVPQAEPTTALVGSRDKELLVLDAGHVGLMCSPVARNELWPRICDWLRPRSEQP